MHTATQYVTLQDDGLSSMCDFDGLDLTKGKQAAQHCLELAHHIRRRGNLMKSNELPKHMTKVLVAFNIHLRQP